MNSIARLRKKLKYTREDLASLIEVNERTIRRWENNEVPTPKIVILYLQHRVDAAALMEGK